MSDDDPFNKLSQIIAIRCDRALSTPPLHLFLLQQSAKNGYVRILKNVMGDQIGYITWISLSSHSLRLSLKTHTIPPYPYEWNEGRIKLIYDGVFLRGWEIIARNELKSFVLKERLVTYYKGDKVKIMKHTRRQRD